MLSDYVNGEDSEIIDELDREEKRVFNNEPFIPETTRDGLNNTLRNILRKGANMSSSWNGAIGPFVNVIPSNNVSRCYPELRVFIGSSDDTHLRFFEALAHIALDCHGTLLVVIHFGSGEINYQSQEVQAFRKLKDCRTFIKPFGRQAFRI